MKAYLQKSSIVDFLKAYLNIRIQGKNDRNKRYPRSNMKTAILGLQRWLYSEHLQQKLLYLFKSTLQKLQHIQVHQLACVTHKSVNLESCTSSFCIGVTPFRRYKVHVNSMIYDLSACQESIFQQDSTFHLDYLRHGPQIKQCLYKFHVNSMVYDFSACQESDLPIAKSVVNIIAWQLLLHILA